MKKSTLLIADDVLINREMLKDIFDGKYNILEACDGEEAIELLDKHKTEIVLVFLDLVMPKKDGLEVIEYLKENHSVVEVENSELEKVVYDNIVLQV